MGRPQTAIKLWMRTKRAMQSCEPFSQTRRTSQTIKRMRRTVPKIPPPKSIAVSTNVYGPSWNHADEDGVGAVSYRIAPGHAGF
jgi:hypothetical protein